MDEQTQTPMQVQEQQREIAELKSRLRKLEVLLDNTWYMALGAILLTVIFRYGFKGLVGMALVFACYLWYQKKV